MTEKTEASAMETFAGGWPWLEAKLFWKCCVDIKAAARSLSKTVLSRSVYLVVCGGEMQD